MKGGKKLGFHAPNPRGDATVLYSNGSTEMICTSHTVTRIYYCKLCVGYKLVKKVKTIPVIPTRQKNSQNYQTVQ